LDRGDFIVSPEVSNERRTLFHVNEIEPRLLAIGTVSLGTAYELFLPPGMSCALRQPSKVLANQSPIALLNAAISSQRMLAFTH
jgi:hypothetical protein